MCCTIDLSLTFITNKKKITGEYFSGATSFQGRMFFKTHIKDIKAEKRSQSTQIKLWTNAENLYSVEEIDYDISLRFVVVVKLISSQPQNGRTLIRKGDIMRSSYKATRK